MATRDYVDRYKKKKEEEQKAVSVSSVSSNAQKSDQHRITNDKSASNYRTSVNQNQSRPRYGVTNASGQNGSSGRGTSSIQRNTQSTSQGSGRSYQNRSGSTGTQTYRQNSTETNRYNNKSNQRSGSQRRITNDKSQRNFQTARAESQRNRAPQDPWEQDRQGDAYSRAGRVVRNTGKVMKESAKQAVYDDLIAANDLGTMTGSYSYSDDQRGVFDRKKYDESQKRSRELMEHFQKKRDESEQKVADITKDATGLEKAIYGAAESGVGMGTDIAFGPLSLAHMGVRSYGAQRGKAQVEGATENEDRLNALLQGAKEAATEKLFSGIGIARKVTRGTGLNPAERLANRVTQNMSGRLADLTHAGIRYGGGIAEENIEELAGWIVDPVISELSYQGRVRGRKKDEIQSMLRQESDKLRSNITDEQSAQAVSAYLSSGDFLEQNKKAYMEDGIPEGQAQAMAEKMRDYLAASLSGDTGAMEDLQDQITESFTGKGLSKDSWSFGDLMDTFAATTLLTGVTGAGTTISSTRQGNRLKQAYGADGIKALANTAIDFEDGEMSLKAQAMRDRIESGKDITATQAADLAMGLQRQAARDNERERDYIETAERTIGNSGNAMPFQYDRNGNLHMDEVLQKNYTEEGKSAERILKSSRAKAGDSSITDTEIETGKKAIAGFKTGMFTVNDANTLNFSNTFVRSAFSEATGVDLNQYVVRDKKGNVDIPATNTATKNALFAMAADNLAKSAEVETQNWMDKARGETVTQISARMGTEGTAALQNALRGLDERDRRTYLMNANAADIAYQGGRNLGIDWEEAESTIKRLAPGIPGESLKPMYEAGLRDREISLDTAKGRQTKIDTAINENVDAGRENRDGQILIETKSAPKGSVIQVFSEIARNTGVNIHLVDDLEAGKDKDGNVTQANGQYVNGEIWLNVNSSFEKNLGFIFMHEMTHHLKMYAPEEYKKLEDLVREKWFKENPEGMQARIARKIESYKKAGQTLTEEEALEEIIADSAHEFLTDEKFAMDICEEEPSLAKSIINAIKNALRNLRAVFASEPQDTYMDSIFSQLGILEEAERLWLSAYKQAAKNRAAIGAVEWGVETIVKENPFEPYSEEQINNWANSKKIVIYRDEKQFRQFIKDARNGSSDNKKMYFGIVPVSLAQRVKDKTGVDISGKNIALSSNEIRKIIKSHGNAKKEEKWNQRPVTEDDIVNIINVIANPDDIVLSPEEYHGRPAIKFKKKINGEETVVAYDSLQRQEVRVQTVYVGVDNKKRKSPVATDEQASVNTPEATNGTPSNNTIPSSAEESNRNSITDTEYLSAVRSGDMETAQRMVDEAAKAAGYTVKAYHQTAGGFTVFDTSNPHAGRNDSETPNGIFFKTNNHDIGLEGKEQLAAYLNTGRTLHFKNREEANAWYRSHVKDYAALDKAKDEKVGELDKRMNELEDLMFGEGVTDEEYDRLNEEWDSMLEDMHTIEDGYRGRLRDLLNDYFLNSGSEYDSIHLDYDGHRWVDGKREDVETYIVFKSNQAKLADPVTYDDDGNVIPLSERFNRSNPDIRYSVSDNVPMSELDKSGAVLEDENGEPVMQFDQDGSVRLSVTSYDAEGRKKYKAFLKNAVEKGDLTQEEADEMLREMETIFNICNNFADSGKYLPFTAWSEAEVLRDEKGRPIFSSVKKNSEYGMNMDFSTICKKRRTLDAVFNEMVKRGMFERMDLNMDESSELVVRINDIIREHGFEAACALCFVEARRYRQQQTATTFTNMYNDLVKSLYKDESKIAYFNYGRDDTAPNVENGIDTMDDSELDLSKVRKLANAKKNGKPLQTAEAKAARLILNDPSQRKLMRVGDMMSSVGFENFQVENPDLMKVYNSKKGTGGAKSSFGDVQYLNEIIRSKSFNRMKAYMVSGVRIQSFSDYVPRMVFDYVQMIGDLAAKKLPAHSYTKEVLYALQFGLTGVKINLSLVPDVAEDGIAPGLDKNGNYLWNADGTFPFEDFEDEKGKKWPGARTIQKAEGYKENCGTIAVGISDAQILKMLADPEIQMVIPYHKSSLNPLVAAMTNVDRFEDYTDYQNTKDAEGKSLSGKKDFPWDRKLFRLTHDKDGNLLPKSKWGDPQDLVKEYAAWCKKKGYTPKFEKFLYLEDGKAINPGYYKLLEDFALYDNDGNFKPQGDVKMNFPTEESTFGSMASLIESGLEEDAILEGQRTEDIENIVDEIEESAAAGTLVEGKRFSISLDLSALEGHDEAWYNHHGWVVVNGVLDSRELSSFLEETRHLNKHIQNEDGLYAIPVASRNAIGAFTVLTDGADDPSIESVWQILDTNTDVLKEFTEVFGDVQGFKGILQDAFIKDYYSDEAVRVHRREDYYDYKEIASRYEREYGRSHMQEDGELQDRRRGNQGFGSVKLSFTEDDVISSISDDSKDTETVPLQDPVLEEGRRRMAKSKDDFLNSRWAKWDERWLTEGEILDTKSVEKEIRELVMGVMQNSDTDRMYKKDLVDQAVIDAKKAYRMMKQGKVEEASLLLWDNARNMIESADFVNDDLFNQFKEIRDHLRHTEIRVGEEFWNTPEFKDFRKRNFGRLLIKKGNTNIDNVYMELNEMVPGAFPKDIINPVDQLLAIEDFLERIQPYKEAYSSEEASALAWEVATDLADIVYGGEEYRSVADKYKEKYRKEYKEKYKEKTRLMKARHREAVRKIREEEKAKRERQRQRAEMWKAREKKLREDKKEAREKAKHKVQFGSIQKNIQWLTKRLNDPTKDQNIPQPFRAALGDMLSYFDMQTVGSKKWEAKHGTSSAAERLRKLREQFADVAKEDYSGPFTYNGYLFDLMDAMIRKVDGKAIDEMDLSDMKDVDTLLKAIVHNFRTYNKIRLENKQVEIAEIGKSVIDDMSMSIVRRGQAKTYGGVRGALDNIVNMAELTPIYFFKRMGTMFKMYMEVRRGFDKYIKNEADLIDKLGKILQPYYNKKRPGSELESWRDDRSARTFDFSDGTITLTVSQMMSLYCLSKREQALGHILNDGIVVTPIQVSSKMKQARDNFKGKVENSNSVRIEMEELQEIRAALTPEQVEMADQLQKLMSDDMAKLGNEASMEMYGIEMFKDKDYFPIKVAGSVTATNIEKIDIRETIKNPGFAKALTPGARNVIEIDDIFSVVASHCNDMNLYNAYSVPISDFMRVYNYKQYLEDAPSYTVQQAIENAFGKKALTYIDNFMRDINGSMTQRKGGFEDVLNSALGRAKRAAVFANMRVALQQPTAIVRALVELKPKYFIGTRPSKDAMEEMHKYCPIAQWKNWGYYDTHFGRDIEDVMMNNWSRSEVAMSGIYGLLDDMTWSMIWQAVKKEVAAQHPNADTSSEDFLNLCGERASFIFDTTQVVDSPFHRSDSMRSKDNLVRQMTSFYAEPTLTFNVVRAGIAETYDHIRRKEYKEAGKAFNRTMGVFVLQAATVGATAALWDAVRGKDADSLLKEILGGDDDDDKDKEKGYWERWYENFLANFQQNLSIWNNIYVVKDIAEIFEQEFGGYSSNNNLMFQGFDTLAKGLAQAKKKYEKGENYSKSWYDISINVLGGFGYIAGVPIKTLMKDAKPVFDWFANNVFASTGYTYSAELENGTVISTRNFDEYLDVVDSHRASGDLKATSREGKGNEVRHFFSSIGIGSVSKEPESMEEFSKATREKASVKTSRRKTAFADMTDQEKIESLKESLKDVPKEKRTKKAWDKVNDGYKDLLAKGDYSSVYRMRKIVQEVGGDTSYVDKLILEESKRAFKKTILSDPTDEQIAQQGSIMAYLKNNGVSTEEISDIVYHSGTVKDLKAAMRLNDMEAIKEELVPLIRAGLTYDDFVRVWENRNSGKQQYSGKYHEREKEISTGTFNWPAQGVITSGYGRRKAPTRGASSWHQGIDIGGSIGDPIKATDGGTVTYAGWNGGYGYQVVVKHADGSEALYSHLDSYNVKPGDIISQGDQIARMGSTGTSTGPHLDFRIRVNGKFVDPTSVLAS